MMQHSQPLIKTAAVVDHSLLGIPSLAHAYSSLTFHGSPTVHSFNRMTFPTLLDTLQNIPAPRIEELIVALSTTPNNFLNMLLANSETPHLRRLSLVGVRSKISPGLRIFRAPLTSLCVHDAHIWNDWRDVLAALHHLPGLQTLILNRATETPISTQRLSRTKVVLQNLRVFMVAIDWTEIDILLHISMPSNVQLSLVLGPRTNTHNTALYEDFMRNLRDMTPSWVRKDLHYTDLSIEEFKDLRGNPALGFVVTAHSPLPQAHGPLQGGSMAQFAPAQRQFQFEGDRRDDLPALCALIPVPEIQQAQFSRLFVSHRWFASASAWHALLRARAGVDQVRTVHLRGTDALLGLLDALIPSGAHQPILPFPALETLVLDGVRFDPPSPGRPSVLDRLLGVLHHRRGVHRPIKLLEIRKSFVDMSDVLVLNVLSHDGSKTLQTFQWDGQSVAA